MGVAGVVVGPRRMRSRLVVASLVCVVVLFAGTWQGVVGARASTVGVRHGRAGLTPRRAHRRFDVSRSSVSRGGGPTVLPFLTPALTARRPARGGGVVALPSRVVGDAPMGSQPRASTGSTLKGLIAFGATSFASDPTQTAPPDTQVAAGPRYIGEAVNDALTVWSRGGSLVRSSDLNTFFPVPAGYIFTDPRIVYDVISSRWFLSGLAFNSGFDSREYLAVSDSTDPTAGWSIYQIASYSGTVTDQPKIGVSSDKVVISWSDFTNSGTVFAGQETWVGQKSDLLAGVTVRNVGFSADLSRFDVVPVTSLTATSTEYLVYNNTCSNSAGTGSGSCTTTSASLGLVAITGTPAANTVAWTESDPAMSQTASPPNARQPFGNSIDTNDDRFLSAVWQNGTLWTTANDACVVGGVTQSCLRIVEVTTGGSPTVLADSDLGLTSQDLYYPAVTLDSSGDPYMVATVSSASIYPSVIVYGRSATSGGFVGRYLWHGSGDYSCSFCGPGGNRWGDYSGAAIDPSNPDDVWVAGEYAPAAGGNDWGTAIGEFTFATDQAPRDCVIRSKANGRYVSAELGYKGSSYGALRARATTVGAWERYQCVALSSNKWAIESRANQRYTSAELGYKGSTYGMLRARSTSIGSWETYTLTTVSACSCVAIRAANSKFVSAELGYTGSTYGLLRARSASIGPWEEFTISAG
jgi:hypothetical protein